MKPADDLTPKQLIGKRIAFKDGEDHHACWHYKVGLRTGLVLKLNQSLAQKAELIGSEELLPPELLSAECDVPRLWVKADPCKSFPRGCEAAVEVDCLQIIDPTTG